MDTEEASPSFPLQYACGDTWQPEVSFLRLLICSPLGGQLGKRHRASDGRAAAFLPGTIRGFSPSLGSVCHLGRGFYQLVNCCLCSSSWINYSSFVWWQKCFLSFKTAFENTISSSCFVCILWWQGSNSHNQHCLNFESHQRISSVQFSCSVMSDSLRPHESQHTRPPCPSQTPGVYSNTCPSSWWCHQAISSSFIPFSCPQSLPGSGTFPMSQLFVWGGQSIGVSASVSVLPMNTQDWSPLGWTGWISLLSKGLSRVFSNTPVRNHQFFGAQLSSESNSHIHTWPLEKP